MAGETLDVERIRAFCWPFWRIFWIGWVMVKRRDPQPLYYDNNPYVTFYSSEDICYVTLGFTERGVIKRLKRYIEKVTDRADRRDE